MGLGLGKKKERKTHLDSRLERLNLDRRRFVKTVNLHVDDFPRISIDSERVLSVRVLGLMKRNVKERKKEGFETSDQQLQSRSFFGKERRDKKNSPSNPSTPSSHFLHNSAPTS